MRGHAEDNRKEWANSVAERDARCYWCGAFNDAVDVDGNFFYHVSTLGFCCQQCKDAFTERNKIVPVTRKTIHLPPAEVMNISKEERKKLYMKLYFQEYRKNPEYIAKKREYAREHYRKMKGLQNERQDQSHRLPGAG